MRRLERAILRPIETNLSPQWLATALAEIFASLDAMPRELRVEVDMGAARGYTVNLVDGNPVFEAPRQISAQPNFRGRWLAEHPIPLSLEGRMILRFLPTTGNRVKVRLK